MKKIFVFTIILLAVLVLLPLTAITDKDIKKPSRALPTAVDTTVPKTDTFKVLITATGETREMPVNEYLFGVISAEMPALYENEALKAQAVCAYTFALWRKKGNEDKPYDITDDFTTDQCYISREEAVKRWGSKSEEYTKKIEKVINDTQQQALCYNGEIILSVYHSVSGGMTESAKNVWGKDYPYLQSAESVGDKLAKNYISQTTITAEKLKSTLGITEITQNPFTDFVRTAAGTVKTVKICGKEYKGSEIRQKFDLKSSNFETEFKNGNIIFTCYGYGHGVGMSQNGANYMAQQGFTYKQILSHYYKGTQVIKQ